MRPGFVLITSEADDGRFSVAEQAQSRASCLPKPFTASQLVEALNQVTGASMPLPPARCQR